ncbi:helix-turn-helix domain-containing protein [Erysipelothrix rhusiopathiae]|nr:helix-turn-helix domain-containing protein [Erysipelothrix rhusiopathiae]MDE9421722.1 helix-turn-helix domain-containing protein [Erysipelothrix rhusiopathiae]
MNSQTAHLDKEQQDFLKKLGKNIIEVRRKKRMSRLKLSELSGLHTQYLLDVEAGRKNLGIYMVAQIARSLDIPLSELLQNINLKSMM